MALGHVNLTKVQKTCLPTLYGKALDARQSDSILCDSLADQAVQQLDFDFATLKLPKGAAISLPIRAKHLDGWTKRFLASYPQGIVLQLGCGLDTRVYRVDPPADINWYDIDMPEVIALRQELYPQRAGYEMISSSITDPTWLEQIPADRPVLVVAEGLVMHVPTADLVTLFNRITGKFLQGQVIFDVYSELTARVITLASKFTAVPVSLHSGLPQALMNKVPALKLVDSTPFLTLPDLVAHLSHSVFARMYFRAVAAGFMKNSMLHMRYRFG